VKATGDAARKLGVTLQPVELRGLRDLEDVFATVVRQRAEALLVVGDPLIFVGRLQIANLAARHRLPAIYTLRAYVETGGLMSYGPNGYEQIRRAATYVARILKGARPGELPMEQPTKLEFVINLKAAKALGLTIPQSVLVRADQLIE
jgi:putative ABC transport system substrate-binding protein